jgi:hypothetical protein
MTKDHWMLEVAFILTPWHWEVRWENGGWWKTYQFGPFRLVAING